MLKFQIISSCFQKQSFDTAEWISVSGNRTLNGGDGMSIYYFRETLYLSLIILTQPAPIIRNTPANISMFTSSSIIWQKETIRTVQLVWSKTEAGLRMQPRLWKQNSKRAKISHGLIQPLRSCLHWVRRIWNSWIRWLKNCANNKIKKLLPAEYEIRRKQAEIVFLQGFFYESYWQKFSFIIGLVYAY